MKKIFASIIAFVFLFTFVGCRKRQYPYMNDVTSIISIEIVLVNENEDIYGHDLQTTIAVVENKEQFLKDLSEIKFSHVFGYAYGIEDGKTAIKLIYENNDYELITACGAATYRFSDDHYNRNAGVFTCQTSDFENLIAKYL